MTLSIRKNPFSREPIKVNKDNYKEKFIGRGKEIEKILGNLIQVAQGTASHMFIYGKDGVGKTSLINYIEFIVNESKNYFGFNAEEYYDGVLYFIIAKTIGFEMKTLEESINPLLIDLEKNLKKKNIKFENIKFGLEFSIPYLSKAKVETTLSNNRINIPLNIIEQLSETLEKVSDIAFNNDVSGVLLVIDNIDALVKDFNIGQFFKVLSEKINKEYNNISMIFIGKEESLEKMIEQEYSINGILDKIEVNNFNVEEIGQCLDISKKDQVIFTEESINLIYEYTDGNPSLVQQIAYETFRNFKGQIGISEMKKIIDIQEKNQVHYLKSKIKNLDYRHRRVLNIIINSTNGIYNKYELSEWFKKNVSNEVEEFQSCVKHLEKQGLINICKDTVSIINKLYLEALKREEIKNEYC